MTEKRIKMDNNEMKNIDISTEPYNADRPKPLRKLVRIDHSSDAGSRPADPGTYRGRYEADPVGPRGRYEADPVRPRGRYEAEPVDPRSRYQSAPDDDYLPKHDPSLDEYMGKYNRADEYIRVKPKRVEEHRAANVLVKIASVVVSLVLICTLILNMPICLDRKTNKNASIIYLLKHWTPANKEGDLDKSEIKNTVIDQVVYEVEDYNDGLDLPQLVEGQYSVLFIGFEPDEYNTDIMWVLQFDIGHGALNILQIPRDCCLPDYTSSAAKKFNSIYSMGNPDINPPIQRTVNAIQENFGIPIDAYVTTTCPDIVEIIDIIGGVPIHLDNAIDFEPSAPGTQYIPAGDIVLSGQQSEWFIRYRSGWVQGDIGRMQNQRRFMAAAMRKLLNIVEDEGKLKLYSYIKEIFNKDLVYTDMSLDDMSKLADFASTISMEDAKVNMVPGEDAWYYAEDGNEYSVYSVHKQATIDLLNAYYRPYQRPMLWDETTIVELVPDYDYEYNILDDTSQTLEDLENSTEPIRKSE